MDKTWPETLKKRFIVVNQQKYILVQSTNKRWSTNKQGAFQNFTVPFDLTHFKTTKYSLLPLELDVYKCAKKHEK